jgi:hypothetical protein
MEMKWVLGVRRRDLRLRFDSRERGGGRSASVESGDAQNCVNNTSLSRIPRKDNLEPAKSNKNVLLPRAP